MPQRHSGTSLALPKQQASHSLEAIADQEMI
jgi:hypothetical protein